MIRVEISAHLHIDSRGEKFEEGCYAVYNGGPRPFLKTGDRLLALREALELAAAHREAVKVCPGRFGGLFLGRHLLHPPEVMCPDCKGGGLSTWWKDLHGSVDGESCSLCDGTGKIARSLWEEIREAE